MNKILPLIRKKEYSLKYDTKIWLPLEDSQVNYTRLGRGRLAGIVCCHFVAPCESRQLETDVGPRVGRPALSYYTHLLVNVVLLRKTKNVVQ